MEGRLEILNNGLFGTVCDSSWEGFSQTNVNVACSELGMTGGTLGLPGQSPGEYTIWLDQVFCWGTEASIAECSNSGWGVHNCFHGQDVYIECQSCEDDASFVDEKGYQ